MAEGVPMTTAPEGQKIISAFWPTGLNENAYGRLSQKELGNHRVSTSAVDTILTSLSELGEDVIEGLTGDATRKSLTKRSKEFEASATSHMNGAKSLALSSQNIFNTKTMLNAIADDYQSAWEKLTAASMTSGASQPMIQAAKQMLFDSASSASSIVGNAFQGAHDALQTNIMSGSTATMPSSYVNSLTGTVSPTVPMQFTSAVMQPSMTGPSGTTSGTGAGSLISGLLSASGNGTQAFSMMQQLANVGTGAISAAFNNPGGITEKMEEAADQLRGHQSNTPESMVASGTGGMSSGHGGSGSESNAPGFRGAGMGGMSQGESDSEKLSWDDREPEDDKDDDKEDKDKDRPRGGENAPGFRDRDDEDPKHDPKPEPKPEPKADQEKEPDPRPGDTTPQRGGQGSGETGQGHTQQVGATQAPSTGERLGGFDLRVGEGTLTGEATATSHGGLTGVQTDLTYVPETHTTSAADTASPATHTTAAAGAATATAGPAAMGGGMMGGMAPMGMMGGMAGLGNAGPGGAKNRNLTDPNAEPAPAGGSLLDVLGDRTVSADPVSEADAMLDAFPEATATGARQLGALVREIGDNGTPVAVAVYSRLSGKPSVFLTPEGSLPQGARLPDGVISLTGLRTLPEQFRADWAGADDPSAVLTLAVELGLIETPEVVVTLNTTDTPKARGVETLTFDLITRITPAPLGDTDTLPRVEPVHVPEILDEIGRLWAVPVTEDVTADQVRQMMVDRRWGGERNPQYLTALVWWLWFDIHEAMEAGDTRRACESAWQLLALPPR